MRTRIVTGTHGPQGPGKTWLSSHDLWSRPENPTVGVFNPSRPTTRTSSRAARAAGARASTASGLPLGVMTSMTRRAQAPSATIWKGAATGVFRKTRLALPWAARAHNTPAWAPTPMAGFAPSTYGRFCSVYRGIGCRCSADAVTKPDPSSNSLSLEDSGSISELDMPKGRPSRPRTWVEGDSRRERPVTAGAIVIPIHSDIVVSLPRR